MAVDIVVYGIPSKANPGKLKFLRERLRKIVADISELKLQVQNIEPRFVSDRLDDAQPSLSAIIEKVEGSENELFQAAKVVADELRDFANDELGDPRTGLPNWRIVEVWVQSLDGSTHGPVIRSP